jgi:signal transduction histidine kinase
MMKAAAATPEEQDFLLSSLSPGPVQKRLALGVVLLLFVAFLITAGPLSTIPPKRIDAFLPIYVTAMFVNDSLTAILLFAQYSILRTPALLAISNGYLFTAFIVVPWACTFPGVLAPAGLLGAGPQGAIWLYVLWHSGFPIFVIAYALLKDRNPTKRLWRRPVWVVILSSVATTAGIVCAATLLVRAGRERLPELVMADEVHLTRLWLYAAGFAALLSVLAVAVLWVRRRSVLDLWLMVVIYAWLSEMCMISFPTLTRYRIGFYAGRVCGVLSASLVLFVLLYEISTLYSRLLLAVRAQRREREARLMTGAAVSASIAHEVNQPLSAIVTDANAGRRWLDRGTPDLHEGIEAFKRIVTAGERAGAVIGSIRAMFKKDVRTRKSLDINEVIREALTLMGGEVQTHRISVHTELDERLPRVKGDQVQLQQVVLNLVANAIDAMAAKDGARVLWVKSSVHGGGGVMVSVEDSGTGVQPEDIDQLFNPLFTTKAHGMGMGLSICRSIIEGHQGQLWAVSNAPQGGVFRFVVPADTAPGGLHEESSAATSGSTHAIRS